MLFIEKCKESVISAVPVVILVLLLHFTVAPLGKEPVYDSVCHKTEK